MGFGNEPSGAVPSAPSAPPAPPGYLTITSTAGVRNVPNPPTLPNTGAMPMPMGIPMQHPHQYPHQYPHEHHAQSAHSFRPAIAQGTRTPGGYPMSVHTPSGFCSSSSNCTPGGVQPQKVSGGSQREVFSSSSSSSTPVAAAGTQQGIPLQFSTGGGAAPHSDQMAAQHATSPLGARLPHGATPVAMGRPPVAVMVQRQCRFCMTLNSVPQSELRFCCYRCRQLNVNPGAPCNVVCVRQKKKHKVGTAAKVGIAAVAGLGIGLLLGGPF